MVLEGDEVPQRGRVGQRREHADRAGRMEDGLALRSPQLVPPIGREGQGVPRSLHGRGTAFEQLQHRPRHHRPAQPVGLRFLAVGEHCRVGQVEVDDRRAGVSVQRADPLECSDWCLDRERHELHGRLQLNA